MNRDQFFASAPAFPKESVEVPGLGSVNVRVMSAGDRDAFESLLIKATHDDFRARLVMATACDDDGKLIFLPGDLPKLSALPYTTLQPLADAAVKLNRLGSASAEDEVKNSDPAQP